VRRLTEAGVHVYDPTNLLIQAKSLAYAAGEAAGGPGGLGGDAEFFRADSHWTPATGELVALDMAHEINRTYKLPPHPALNLKRIQRGTAQSADLLHLLGLPPNQKLFQADVRPAFVVTRANGTAMGVDKDADVLLLGDSFSGLYDDAGAGMAQHLARGLGRPVDVISVPNGGSWGARFNLVAEMRAGHDRLANKKLVIYEFVDRDLSFGDWKPAQLPKFLPRAAAAAAVTVPEAAGAPVTTHFRRRRRHRRHRA
jgi:hypothetical protein